MDAEGCVNRRSAGQLIEDELQGRALQRVLAVEHHEGRRTKFRAKVERPDARREASVNAERVDDGRADTQPHKVNCGLAGGAFYIGGVSQSAA